MKGAICFMNQIFFIKIVSLLKLRDTTSLLQPWKKKRRHMLDRFGCPRINVNAASGPLHPPTLHGQLDSASNSVSITAFQVTTVFRFGTCNDTEQQATHRDRITTLKHIPAFVALGKYVIPIPAPVSEPVPVQPVHPTSTSPEAVCAFFGKSDTTDWAPTASPSTRPNVTALLR